METKAKLDAQAKKVADDRAKLEAEKKAAAKAARDAEIKNASLTGAATEALELLKAEGFGEHITLKNLSRHYRKLNKRKQRNG